MAKYKATSCSRFLIFFLIFAPIAYFGSQYLMESGKWDNIRSKMENVSEDKNSVERAVERKSETGDISGVQDKLERLLDKIKEQEKVIATQEDMINKQSGLIEQLKNQIQQVQETPPIQKTEPKSDGSSLQDLLKEADKALKNN